MDPLLGFMGGIGVSLSAALIAHIFTVQRDRQKIVSERRFEIYMKLIELHGSYWWFTTAEAHRTEPSNDARQRVCALTWFIADKLRAADEVEFLDEIIDVLMGSEFPTAIARYEAMDKLIEKLGKRVNPRYSKKLKAISAANSKRLGTDDFSKVPASCWRGPMPRKEEIERL